jgi:transposase InsO family protein
VRVVSELRLEFPLDRLLKLAGIPRSTYYYILKRLDRQDCYQEVKEVIQQIVHEHKGRYGYRRVTIEMQKRGYTVNHKVVMRLMKELHLTCRVRMKKYRSYRGKVGHIAPNLLQRQFTAEKPNEKWVTDITEFNLFSQKLYLSPILDLYNGEIISYSIHERPAYGQVKEMLNAAFAKTPDDTNLILHSDQGWQFQMEPYVQALKAKGIRQSMSRKGNCLDNSIVENFFGLLKSELLYLQEFKSLEDFKSQLVEYMDYYNNHRIKCKLKGLSPVQYRNQSLTAA